MKKSIMGKLKEHCKLQKLDNGKLNCSYCFFENICLLLFNYENDKVTTKSHIEYIYPNGFNNKIINEENKKMNAYRKLYNKLKEK